MKRNLSPVRTLIRELIPVVGSFAPGVGTLAYDNQSGNFTAGLTLTGGTSSATATILSDTDAGATGTLKLVDIVGTFENNEALTDSSTGAADANGTAAAGDDAPTARKGLGWSVARTSTGLYTITFADGFNELVSVKATLQLATADDKTTQIGAVSLSARTIQIRIWDKSAAAVADVLADTNNRIHFVAFFRASAASPSRG